MTEQFKVGDRVQFKTWDEIAGRAIFSPEMKHLCGTYATVFDVRYDRIWLTEFTADGIPLWAFAPEMLKHAKEEREMTETEWDRIIKQIATRVRYYQRTHEGERPGCVVITRALFIKLWKLSQLGGDELIRDIETGKGLIDKIPVRVCAGDEPAYYITEPAIRIEVTAE